MNYPIVVTAGGTIVSGENGYLTTSRTAETVVTFDIGFTSLPSYTGGSIRQGDQLGFWLAPSDNTSNYLSVDPLSGTPSVISAPNGKYLSKINYTYLTNSCLLPLAFCLS